MFWKFLPVGTASMMSRVITFCCVTRCVSTTGDSPVTVTVSSRAPTFMSALTGAVNPVVSSMPSRLMMLKPANVNVTVYRPGLRSTILYWPLSSVIAVRVRSIRAGLLASTATPGSTAPVVSFTTPAMLPVCAAATTGSSTKKAREAREAMEVRGVGEVRGVREVGAWPSRPDRPTRSTRPIRPTRPT